MAAVNMQIDAGGMAIDWQQALAQHGRWLRTVVVARQSDPEAVDEIMQEVALAAVRQGGQFNSGAKVGAWLYRVAIRQTLLYRRRQGRYRQRLQRCQEQSPPSGASLDPLAWLLRIERASLVRNALGRLNQRDRQILLLKYTEDCSCQDLAERLGVSERAIQSRLHRARGRLRQELSRLDETTSES